MDNIDKENNDKWRTFICIDFPQKVLAEVTRVQEEVGKIKFQGKLTEVENLHLTLKFLGEIEEQKVNEVRKKLKDVKFKEMELRLGEAGLFSFHGNPRIVWIKVEGGKIWELQKEIDNKMNDLGFKKEERFMSHLTIARIKYVKNKEEFTGKIPKIGVKGIKFKLGKFKLMKSELKPIGPVYTIIEEYLSN
ncbi:RNA 2',3'-cyclic phosphodiesterase [Candidatus Pacearchaeota archaeon]|nr:RNA 2',3'-cyclic phosphodiesterase [Candidatus Pacearchaeota archaeon]